MGYVARLSQRFGRKDSNGLSEAGRGGLEGSKAAGTAGFKFHLKKRQNGPVEDDWEGLGKSADRGQGDGAAGAAGVVQ
jgi:hypothetical protein